MRNTVSPELKAQIIAMRQCGHTYTEITKATGIGRGALGNIFTKAGLVNTRDPISAAPEVMVESSPVTAAPAAPAAVVQKFCSKCAKAIVITPAKFCYHCGAALLSEEELLVEELNAALRTLGPLATIPSRTKDTIRDALVHSIAYLEKDK